LVAIIVLLARIAQDVLDHKLGGGFVGRIIGDLYEWTVIGPNFLFGMIVYVFRDDLPRSRGLFYALLVAAVTSAYISLHAAHVFVPVALAYGLFHVAFSKTVRLSDAARWGDFSYGTYLYAFPIQQMIVALTLGDMLPFPIYIALSMALSLVAGIASWHAVEKWFLRRPPVIRSREPLITPEPEVMPIVRE
jgi:peptidoglycan/LPS O-acetylase OafA/YrhL